MARSTPSKCKGVVIIIGGCGYVGLCIASEMCKQGYKVVLADINSPPTECPGDGSFSFAYCECDITDEDSIESMFARVDVEIAAVINLASAGMSGAAMLSPETEKLNVLSARLVVEACKKHDICTLLYASTYNVVFGGEEIVLGTSKTPYFPYEKHTDYYSRSKALAEQLVLKANMNSDSDLRTAVLRPAAIYGEHEKRHFPRIVHHMDCGLFSFRIGNATVDWVHGDNLAQAFVKAMENIDKCAGKVYAISDGTPIDSFGFLEPMCRARHIPYPSIVLPVWFATGLAALLEYIHIFTRLFFGKLAPAPFLTRAEVYKVGVTHTLTIDEARRDFGYKPTITTEQGAERMGKHWKLRRIIDGGKLNQNQDFYVLPPLVASGAVVVAMLTIAHVAFSDVPFSNIDNMYLNMICKNLVKFVLMIFRCSSWAGYAVYCAIIAHIIEAILAVKMARNLHVKWSLCLLWFIQVCVIGFPSWTSLQERHRFMYDITVDIGSKKQ